MNDCGLLRGATCQAPEPSSRDSQGPKSRGGGEAVKRVWPQTPQELQAPLHRRAALQSLPRALSGYKAFKWDSRGSKPRVSSEPVLGKRARERTPTCLQERGCPQAEVGE